VEGILMKDIRKVCVLLFGLIFVCTTAQGMKRLPKVNPMLLKATVDEIEYARWHSDVTAVIDKKAKFEAALYKTELCDERGPWVLMDQESKKVNSTFNSPYVTMTFPK
jgi:hypothetical protein